MNIECIKLSSGAKQSTKRKQTNEQTENWTGRQTENWTDRQTENWTDRQTEKWTDRQTENWTDRKKKFTILFETILLSLYKKFILLHIRLLKQLYYVC